MALLSIGQRLSSQQTLAMIHNPREGELLESR
jgi:hypothetical protein